MMEKRVFVSLFIGIFFCCSLSAQTAQGGSPGAIPDSLFIFHYPVCIQMFKTDYKENRQTLQQFKERLQIFIKGKDTLYVNGYSGACGDEAANLRTAFHRSNNLKGYLINTLGLRERDFKTVNYPYAGASPGDVVAIGFAPLKAANTQPVTIPDTSQAASQTEKVSEATASETQLKQQSVEPAVSSDNTLPAQTPAHTKQPQIETGKPELFPEGRYVALKTNLAAWAGTIMNVAADVQVGRHISVELPVLWCPWYVGSKHAVKTFTVQPEGRYWLSRPGTGHFFGVHAHVGWFNVKWNRDRYQDTGRPLLGAGISYGYLLPFNAHWAGEFTLGAGYANMRYDTYYNIGNGARIDTRTKNYWGITRVGLSVVYRFNLKK